MSVPAAVDDPLNARGLKFAVVAARYNDFVVRSLIAGARAAWRAHRGSDGDLVVARVPGAFELPLTAKRLASSGDYAAVIALGCVIRGETPHFEHIAAACAQGLARAALDTGVPVAFGVLTVDTVEQAIQRAATRVGDKGGEAMASGLEMANLFRRR